MNTKQIDLLNIALIILSAILAYLYPLELMILAFSILGPLHYLTEINWLDKKNYFTNRSKWVWWWIGCSASILIVLPKIYLHFWGNEDSSLSHFFQTINYWSNGFIFSSLLLAVGFVFLKKQWQWYVLIALCILGSLLLNTNQEYTMLIGLFVPTVIHVYLFTLLFMLFGAKKSKSRWGFMAVGVALIVPVCYIFIHVDDMSYLFPDTLKSIYLENNFHVTPAKFAQYLGISDGKSFFFYEQMELRLMMFIAFIYTYHYLNWFSKTSLIAWHKNLTVKRTSIIIGLWLAMLLLFYYNYRLGFLVAIFFSFLHVILEFPLNLVSIKGILKR